jgi:hypothetical protein
MNKDYQMPEERVPQQEQVGSLGDIPTPFVDNSNTELYRPIEIRPLSRGFVVCIGCQQIAFTSKVDMLEHITEYYKTPKQVEKAYRERQILNY